MGVPEAVVCNTKIQPLEVTFLDQSSLTVGLNKDAFLRQAYATELTSCASNAGKAIAPRASTSVVLSQT